MNRLLWWVCVILLEADFCFSQTNLVPNPSFESFSPCPVGAPSSNFYEPYPWYQPTLNNPDYYNQCNNSSSGTAGVPCNWAGCQNARTGMAYAGFGAYYLTPEGREYISVKLNEPLKPNKRYCMEFWVSRSGKWQLAIDRIGAYFSVDSIYSNDIYVLPYQPHVENLQGNILSDTTNWMLISGQFTAQGGEKFLTIGNFYSDNQTTVDTLPGGQSANYAYYYVDDVRVYCCGADSCVISPPPPTPIENFFLPTAFSPNGDGNNDVLHVRGPVKEMDLYIYNRWGELIFHGTDPSKGWDGTYKGELLNAGVFVYYFRGTLLDGTEISQKGNVTLVR
jgi:gliding motility-associated-like protein